MARQNRCDVFDPDQVSTLHCVQRAVRRAMLCGRDPLSQKSYEHRRDWIQDRLCFLAEWYAIDVLGYAIMNNHLHVILRNRPDVVNEWSDQEVARRLWHLFPQRQEADGTPAEPTDVELKMLMARHPMRVWRRRLSDVSWLMRHLAEPIARRANAEDGCTGRFWEGRFKCQPLLDGAAILACAAYVDLNPVRAGIAETPESSDYTSGRDRIDAEKARTKASRRRTRSKPERSRGAKRRRAAARECDDWLAPVFLDERSAPGPQPARSGKRASDKGFLPIRLREYLQLLDSTGRALVTGKRGSIPAHCAPILERLGLDREGWCALVADFGRLFRRVAGSRESLDESARAAGLQHHQSSGGAELLAGAG